jgi:hypothetical protein
MGKIEVGISTSGFKHPDERIIVKGIEPVDKQLKTIIQRIQEKYRVFGNLLDSDVSQLLDSKIELVQIKGEWYIKLQR